MRHYFILLSLLLCWGCKTVQQYPFPGQTGQATFPRPLIYVVYYPYEIEKRSVDALVPSPDYTTWNIERVERDLQRFKKTGIDGVLLAITPQTLADAHRLLMIQHFYKLCSNQAEFLDIILYFTSNTPIEMGRNNTASFVNATEITDYPAFHRREDRPLLLFDSTISLTEEPNTDFSYLKKNMELVPSQIKSPDKAYKAPYYCQYDKSNQTAILYAGFTQKQLSRHKAESLIASLQKALTYKPKAIWLHSWNNYSNNSSIEPNTQENERMLHILSDFFKTYFPVSQK